jgi:hypothetical protein
VTRITTVDENLQPAGFRASLAPQFHELPESAEHSMRQSTRGKLTDLLTTALAVGLAAVCVAFAGYKVVKLRNMENPPADMGLNFPPPKRKIITDDSVRVDPMITGSIGVDAAVLERSGPIRQPYTDEAPIRDYRLLTVIEGVAFVEVQTLRGKAILPLAAGTRLPGAGVVDWVERRDGRWQLKAGDVLLVAEGR